MQNLTIDSILSKSKELQIKYGVSNGCLVVSCTLYKCFNIKQIDTKIIYGYLDGPLKIPHVWLSHNNNIIDNTYNEDLANNPNIKKNLDILYSPSNYKTNIYEVKEQLFFGDNYTKEKRIDNHNFEEFEEGVKNPDAFY